MSPYFGIVPEDESQPKAVPADGTEVETIYVNKDEEKLNKLNILSLIQANRPYLIEDRTYRVFQHKNEENNNIEFEVGMFCTDAYGEKYYLYVREGEEIVLWWDSYNG